MISCSPEMREHAPRPAARQLRDALLLDGEPEGFQYTGEPPGGRLGGRGIEGLERQREPATGREVGPHDLQLPTRVAAQEEEDRDVDGLTSSPA